MWSCCLEAHPLGRLIRPGIPSLRRDGPVCGLNAIPSDRAHRDSCRIGQLLPKVDAPLVQYSQFGCEGVHRHLDFDTILFHGEDVLVEKHYVSKWSRSQKGMLLFLASDAETHFFRYANAERSATSGTRDPPLCGILEEADRPPARGTHLRLQATTYAKLGESNRMGTQFITLRRRSKKPSWRSP